MEIIKITKFMLQLINNAMDLVTAAGNNSTYRFKITEATSGS